jgi:hypothetical protein
MLKQVVEKLRQVTDNQGGLRFPEVGSAMTVANAFDNGCRKPLELYVVPLPGSYRAASQDLGPLVQVGVEDVGVIVGMRSPNDATGTKVASELDALKIDLLACLLGFAPTENHERLTLKSFDPIGLKKDCFWVIYRFSSAVYIRQN